MRGLRQHPKPYRYLGVYRGKVLLEGLFLKKALMISIYRLATIESYYPANIKLHTVSIYNPFGEVSVQDLLRLLGMKIAFKPTPPTI